MNVVLFFSPFVFALLTLFVFSRYLSPRFFKKVPVPTNLYFVINLSFVIIPVVCVFFVSSFTINTFFATSENIEMPQSVDFEEPALSEVDMLARRALQQGSDFSVTLSQLLRLQDHMQALQEKMMVSAANNQSLNDVRRAFEDCWKVLGGQLKNYGVSVLDLSRRDKAYVETVKRRISQDSLTQREKMVYELLFSHVDFYYNNGLLYEEAIFADFTKNFRRFNE